MNIDLLELESKINSLKVCRHNSVFKITDNLFYISYEKIKRVESIRHRGNVSSQTSRSQTDPDMWSCCLVPKVYSCTTQVHCCFLHLNHNFVRRDERRDSTTSSCGGGASSGVLHIFTAPLKCKGIT